MTLRKFFMVFPILLIMAAFLSACSSKQAGPDAKNILFADDFSKSSSGWTQFKNNSGTIEYRAMTITTFP